MRLVTAKEKLADYELEIMKVNKLLHKSVDLLESDAIISSINKKSELLSKLESIKSRIAPILKNINEGNIYLDSNKEEINKYLKAYIDLLKETGICPLCNSKIVEDKLQDIIKHYGEVH
jgi:exonuclease SbcC